MLLMNCNKRFFLRNWTLCHSMFSPHPVYVKFLSFTILHCQLTVRPTSDGPCAQTVSSEAWLSQRTQALHTSARAKVQLIICEYMTVDDFVT